MKYAKGPNGLCIYIVHNVQKMNLTEQAL